MRRRLFNLAAVLSLVLCLSFAAIAMTSRSATRTLGSHVRDPSHATFVLADSSHVRVIRQRVSRTQPGVSVDLTRPGVFTVRSNTGSIDLTRRDEADSDKAVSSPPFQFRGTWTERGGVIYSTIEAPSPAPTDFASGFAANAKEVDVIAFAGSFRRLDVPHWFLIGVTAALPLGCGGSALVRRARGRRRLRAHCCPSCGYDLRATPDRCPECGAEAKPQPAEGAAA